MRKLPALLFALFACSTDRQTTPRLASLAGIRSPGLTPAAPSSVVPSKCLLSPSEKTLPLTSDGDSEGEARVDTSKDSCGVADANLTRVKEAILQAKSPPAIAMPPWDKQSALKYGSLVTGRLALQAPDQSLLAKQGFVVLAKHTFATYARAFHEIHQSQLPIYISIDAILHAIYVGNDSLIAELEDAHLQPELRRIIDALVCQLASAAAEYPAETRRDLDLYLAVSRALLSGEKPRSVTGEPSVPTQASELVAQANAATQLRTTALFGRNRVIDFTAYTPRGHYATSETRQRYFRAGMWLSRLEFNLVSRSCRSSQPGAIPDPRATPREVVLALALSDLVDKAGVGAAVAKLDTAWALLAGRREDVSLAQLGELRQAAGISSLKDPQTAAKLTLAIGSKYQRTARLHYMPEGAKDLPAIATMLGPRVVPDADATRPLVAGELPGRSSLTAADLGYVLGHDRALVHLTAERTKFPELDKQLGIAREIMRTTPRGQDDLYSAWSAAVMALAQPLSGARPSFMQTPAYADLRLDSALLGLGHMKHNYVLVAGESYFAGGCEIPDGYVEPAPATYAALIEYAHRGERSFAILDPKDELGGHAYFQRLAKILAVLRTIGDNELAGRPLTDDEKSFLSMVSELTPGTTAGPPTYTGWWFDMFRKRTQEGLAPAHYIASFFTGAKISYIGATAPRLGVFVIDTGGAPRLVVGPVGRAYEYLGPQAKRLDDAAGKDLPERERNAPWEQSYVRSAPAEPKLGLRSEQGPKDTRTLTIETTTPIGPVTIEFYDHHRQPLGKVTRNVLPGQTRFVVPPGTRSRYVEGVHLIAGAYHGWFDIEIVTGGIYRDLGGWNAEVRE